MTKKIEIMLFSIVIIVLCLSTVDILRGFQDKHGGAKKSPSKTTFSKVPFDTNASELQKKYLGHDLEKIFQILEKRMPESIEKDEFETTQQYNQKLKVESHKSILDSLGLNSTYAFKSYLCETKYDADIQMLKLSCYLGPVFEKGDISRTKKSITWKTKYEYLDSYEGTNAFGASRTIDRSELKWYDIAIENISQFQIERREEMDTFPSLSSSYPNFYLTAMSSIDPTEAKRMKPSIAALVICKLAEPYVTKDQDYESPTFDSPSSSSTYYYHLHVNLIELIFFDSSTGKIVAKIK